MPPNASKEKAARTNQLSFTASDVSRLATAYGQGEDEIQKLLKAPTAKLAKNFMAAALEKAQLCDQLELEKCTNKDKNPFPFMDLPPELRLRIYELVVGDILEQNPPEDFTQRLMGGRIYNRKAIYHLTMVNKVIHTSRTIRTEVLPVCTKVAEDASKVVYRHWTSDPTPPRAEDTTEHIELLSRFVELEDLHNLLRRIEVSRLMMFRKKALFANAT